MLVVSNKKHRKDTERFTPYISRAADDDVEAWEKSGADTSRTSKGALTVLEPDRTVYEKFHRGEGVTTP
ncbi:hypothetical protein SSP35_16_00230 [Streptomyces sp. NBRC 110611]|nr:hypothetical protein SSP35_16_00230 [Streptomyces sp. NBRC 110611]